MDPKDDNTPTTDDDLLAGFSGENGEAPQQEPADEPEPVESPEGDPPPEPEPDPIVQQFGMSAEQIRQSLARVGEIDGLRNRYEQDLSKVHGKFGELNRTLQALQGRSGTLNKGALARLRSEYPEVADLLEEDLQSQAPPAPQAQPQPDLQQHFEQRLQQEVSRVTDGMAPQMLSLVHPDWREIPQSPEFENWRRQQPAEVQRQLNESKDAAWAAQQLTAFKTWRQKQATTTASRNQRLEAAVQPTGVPSTPAGPTTEAAFLAGFKAERGR